MIEIYRWSLPFVPPSLNKMLRMHWSKRRKLAKTMAWEVLAVAGRPTREPLKQCRIEAVRVTRQLLDTDGLYGSMKMFLDCLVECTKQNPYGLGFIVDDNPECLDLVVTQKKGKPGLEVTIYGE